MQHKNNGVTQFEFVFIPCMSKLEFPVAQDLQYKHDVLTIRFLPNFFFRTN